MSLESLEKRLGVQGVAIQLPIGAEDTFEGIIDLIKMKAVYFEGAKGENVIYKEIPEEYMAQAEEYRKVYRNWTSCCHRFSKKDNLLPTSTHLMLMRSPVPEEPYILT